eukprot:5354994-Ditylum_brightwellii.AAC.1
MDKDLFKQHLRHFSQATGTLLTVNPLRSSFGEYAKLPLGQQFRDGTLDVDDLEVDSYTKEFLCELQRKPTDPPEINTILTYGNPVPNPEDKDSDGKPRATTGSGLEDDPLNVPTTPAATSAASPASYRCTTPPPPPAAQATTGTPAAAATPPPAATIRTPSSRGGEGGGGGGPPRGGGGGGFGGGGGPPGPSGGGPPGPP